MDRLLETWQVLDARRRMLLIGAVVATLFGIFMLAQLTAKPGMALLYSGLDPATAGEVLGALETMNVESEVKGDAIFVAEDARDRVRLALARDGLPRQGQGGYELLDQMSGFSSTTDMFNAAYWRAKEGELARTILASSGVRAARVHIAAPSRRPFSAGTAKPTASVTVTMAGGSLSVAQATAIRYLVALAVADLPADQVAVIDARAGVVLAPGKEGGIEDAAKEAADREVRLKSEIEQLLDARVGRDKARVSVTVETDREAETVTESVIEPASRVTLNSNTEEVADSSQGGGGNVTVASNLPAGDAGGGDQRSATRTENRETVQYGYSEVTRAKTRGPGAIRKISVAVLVDGVSTTAADGTVAWAPRPAEELAQLRELVIAAVGYDQARGDIVTIESLAFQPDATPGELVEASGMSRFLERNAMTLIQLGVLTLVIAILALTVLRPLLAARRQTEAEQAAEAATLEGEAAAALAAAEAGVQINADGTLVGPDGTIRLDGPNDAENLRRRIADRPDQALAMLRDWLDPTAVQEEAA